MIKGLDEGADMALNLDELRRMNPEALRRDGKKMEKIEERLSELLNPKISEMHKQALESDRLARESFNSSRRLRISGEVLKTRKEKKEDFDALLGRSTTYMAIVAAVVALLAGEYIDPIRTPLVVFLLLLVLLSEPFRRFKHRQIDKQNPLPK